MPEVQPTNNPVPSDHPADARDNFKRIDEVVNLQAPQTNPTRAGKRLNTLFGIESKYIASPINGGVWASGVEFTAYNQYMAYNGVTYKPSFSTPLPYTTQGADPTASPDDNFVEPFSEINSTNLSDYTDIVFDSVASMVSASPEIGTVCETKSYFSGWAAVSSKPIGGGSYVVVSKSDHDNIRGYSTIKRFDHDLGDNKVALLIFEKLNTAQAGVRVNDSGFDCQPAIQDCVDYAINETANAGFLQNYRAGEYDESLGFEVTNPDGAIFLNKEVLFTGICNFTGQGGHQTVFRKMTAFSSTFNSLLVISRENLPDRLWVLGGLWRGFKVNAGDKLTHGIYQWRHHFYKFEDVIISECDRAWNNYGGYTGKYDRCEMYKNKFASYCQLLDDTPIFEEPNNIDFISCIALDNERGWNLGGATNFNFIGGLTQGHDYQGLLTNGDVGSVNFEGHYFELNARLGDYQINPQLGAIRSMRIEGGQISTSQQFCLADNILELTIIGNNILGTGKVVNIQSGSNIRRLRYENNPRIFNESMTDFVIENQKAGFVPDGLIWSDFDTAATGAYSAAEQFKNAFNGAKGLIKITSSVDRPLTIDFPCTIKGTSKDVGFKRASFDVLTVTNDDVDMEDLLIETATSGVPLKAQGAKGVRCRRVKFKSGTPPLGLVQSDTNSDQVHLIDCDFERSDNGRLFTIDGNKCSVFRGINRGGGTPIGYFDSNSTNCRWSLLDFPVTDTGTGNSEL